MSLFKARDWFFTELGDGDEEFTHGKRSEDTTGGHQVTLESNLRLNDSPFALGTNARVTYRLPRGGKRRQRPGRRL